MKKTIIKNLLDRRFPQLMGSYFVGATSLLLFLDWLVVKYHFTDYVTSLALFGIISIIPTVVILAYFHGAPGKDEWTKIEKYGIPFNFLFIAIVLLIGNKYNVWEDPPPDHSKVYDNFIVYIDSNPIFFKRLLETDEFKDFSSLIDSIYPVQPQDLDLIRDYVSVSLKKEFMNHDFNLYFSENKYEDDLLAKIGSINYWMHLFKGNDDENIQKEMDEEEDLLSENTYKTFEYFNEKHNTNIDYMITVELISVKPSKKGKLFFEVATLGKNYDTLYGLEITATRVKGLGTDDKLIIMEADSEMDASASIEELKQSALKRSSEWLKGLTYGEDIGNVVNIIDSDLVTIKLKNLNVMRGTQLICKERKYILNKAIGISNKSIDTVLNKFIKDKKIIYGYFSKNPDQISYMNEKLDFNMPYYKMESYLEDSKSTIDSLFLNFQDIIDNFPKNQATGHNHSEFRYFLKILNVQDSIATAKITGSIFPFAFPEIGDKVQVK